MIGVFVTFRSGENFDEQAVRKIAESARVRFEGMPGVRPSVEFVQIAALVENRQSTLKP